MRGGWVGMNRSHSGQADLWSNRGLTWRYGRWLSIFALSRGPLARFSEYLSAVFADHCGTGLHALCPQHLVDRVKGSASAPKPFDQVVVRFESGKCLASPGSKLLQERIKVFRGNLVHRSDICGERLMSGFASECVPLSTRDAMDGAHVGSRAVSRKAACRLSRKSVRAPPST